MFSGAPGPFLWLRPAHTEPLLLLGKSIQLGILLSSGFAAAVDLSPDLFLCRAVSGLWGGVGGWPLAAGNQGSHPNPALNFPLSPFYRKTVVHMSGVPPSTCPYVPFSGPLPPHYQSSEGSPNPAGMLPFPGAVPPGGRKGAGLTPQGAWGQRTDW